VQSLPKHPQSSLRAAFSWRWRGMAAAGYLAATAIKIKAHCAFYSWISAIKRSEID
jgi:hypothetical protein